MPHLRARGSSLFYVSLCTLLGALGLVVPAQAQDADRIWGQVHTTSGDVHEGFIVWNRNEASWVDILDGYKDTSGENYAAWLDSRGAAGPPVRTIDLLGFRISWDEFDPEFPATSQSGIRFGHLSSLRVLADDRVELTLRSGELLELEGSRDLGRSVRDVRVDVPGRSQVEVEWEELDRVVFTAVPAGARARARRLHGTVEDGQGNRYTGYVSWDRDEILDSDVLDGEEMVGRDDRQIRYDEIASIERTRRGARVVLVNGAQLDLTDNNDVDRGNRGIRIADPALGVVELEWEEFQFVRFHEPAQVLGYEGFDGGRLLLGTVVMRSGEEIDGVIRWDADEAWSWEMLNGRAADSDDTIFAIEFGNVSRIARGQAFGATVTLLDGRSFELDDSNDGDWDRRYDWDDSNDVSWDNKGIFIQPEGAQGDNGSPSSRWRVIPWDEFREVRFRHDTTSPGRGLE